MKNIVFVSIIDDDEIIRALLLKILKTIEIEQVELDVTAFEGGIPFFASKRAEDSWNYAGNGEWPASAGECKNIFLERMGPACLL